MKKYAELRRARFDRLYPKYKDLIETLENQFINHVSVHYYPNASGKTLKDTDVDTSVRIKTQLTAELVVFLSDYKWHTGVPIQAVERDEYVYISILESDK